MRLCSRGIKSLLLPVLLVAVLLGLLWFQSPSINIAQPSSAAVRDTIGKGFSNKNNLSDQPNSVVIGTTVAKIETNFMHETNESKDVTLDVTSLKTGSTWPPLQFDEKDFYGDKRLLKYRDSFVPRYKKITPNDFKFMITSEHACDGIVGPTLLVIVMSMPSKTRQRQAIRATWGSVATGHSWPGKSLNGTLKLVFLFGNNHNVRDNRDLVKEAARTGDVVQADFTESYYNLTYKVFMGYNWVRRFCPGAKFVMKADEDTFFNVPFILDLIQTKKWNNTIYGPFFYKDNVSRKSKYRVPESAYPAPVYPPHVKGNMYVMPKGLAMNIVRVAEYMPYVNMEDAYITGVLAKVFDARHEGIPKHMYDIHKASKFCDLALGKTVVSQQIFDRDFYKIWERLIHNDLCTNGKYV